MEEYQKLFSRFLAVEDILFFGENLNLKDGRPTPYFVNMGKCNSAVLLWTLGHHFSKAIRQKLPAVVNTIFGPSYKASSIAVATSFALMHDLGLNFKFDYDRKEAKTHGDASGKEKLMVTCGIEDYANIVILDDVATSMVTKYETLKKIDLEVKNRQLANVNISGILVGVDREQTTAVYRDPGDNSTVVLGEKGQNARIDFTNDTKIPVYAIARIRDIIDHLYDTRTPVLQNNRKEPISNQTMDTFRKYMETYGV
tara:strand:+ start:12826 stop:13590 length:765 start_codon:yes stop_codon:yes gene_type:complete